MPDTKVYRVLVGDSSAASAELIRRALIALPVDVFSAQRPEQVLELSQQVSPQLVFLDSGLEVMPTLGLRSRFAEDPAIDLVLMTDDWSEEKAIESVEKGASELLGKPLSIHKVRQLVSGFIAQAETRRRTYELDNELLEFYQFQGIVGRSPGMLQAFGKIRRVAPYFQTVLVTGATGTGKELIARALHNLSPRSNARFTVCNCSALVETLLESELFGHVKGSFTGAVQDKVGLFEYANGGTVFLDEIGELPLPAQAKLLRVLQNRELQRVGSPVARSIDVHVIAATHRNLRELAAKGKFREDLYYRLSMIEVELPPLAARKEDLPLLQRYFLKRFAAKYNKPIKGIARRAQLQMAQYSWPGNVRELENVIGNACMMVEGEIIGITDLPENLRKQLARADRGDPDLMTLEELQNRHLQYVLERVNGNKAQAAEILGVSRATVYEMLSRMNQSHPKGGIYA